MFELVFVYGVVVFGQGVGEYMVVVVSCDEVQGGVIEWVECGVNCFMFDYGDWCWWYVVDGVGVVGCWCMQVCMSDMIVVVFVYVVDYGGVGLQMYVQVQLVDEYVGDFVMFFGYVGFFFDY